MKKKYLKKLNDPKLRECMLRENYKFYGLELPENIKNEVVKSGCYVDSKCKKELYT